MQHLWPPCPNSKLRNSLNISVERFLRRTNDALAKACIVLAEAAVEPFIATSHNPKALQVLDYPAAVWEKIQQTRPGI